MTFTVAIAVVTAPFDRAVTDAAAGQYSATLRAADTSVIATQTTDLPSFRFTGVPGGEHTVEVSRLDVNGAVIGTPVTAPVSAVAVVVVPPVPVSVDVPSTLHVTVTVE